MVLSDCENTGRSPPSTAPLHSTCRVCACTGSVLAPIWTEMTYGINPQNTGNASGRRKHKSHTGGWRTGEPNISHWMRGRPRRQQQHHLGSLQYKIIFIGMIFKMDIYMISNTTNWITFEGLRPPGVMQRLTWWDFSTTPEIASDK